LIIVVTLAILLPFLLPLFLMAAGGKKVGDGLRDTKGEKSLTIFFIMAFVLLVAFALTVYNPDWGGIGNFIRSNWWWILIIGLFLLFAWRAYQGVSLFPNLERVTVGGGGGSGGGGGGGGGRSRIFKTLKFLLMAVVLIIILALILKIFEMLGIIGGWAGDIVGWGAWPWNWW